MTSMKESFLRRYGRWMPWLTPAVAVSILLPVNGP